MKELNQAECSIDINNALLVCIDRIEMHLKSIKETTDIIISEFGYLTLKDIRTALRNGSLAKYGRTYKFSTQEVCYWIREYLKEKKSKQLNF